MEVPVALTARHHGIHHRPTTTVKTYAIPSTGLRSISHVMMVILIRCLG
jgi:hypothetical protein